MKVFRQSIIVLLLTIDIFNLANSASLRECKQNSEFVKCGGILNALKLESKKLGWNNSLQDVNRLAVSHRHDVCSDVSHLGITSSVIS